jgi:hypothetical protein
MTKIFTAETAFADVETSPNLGLFWRAGHKLNISTEQIVRERTLLSASWKYRGKKRVYGVKAKVYRDGSACDYKLVKALTDGLMDAELLIGHNGDKFDWRWVNGRALIHGLPKLAPVRTVDTLKVARKYFDLNSYRLDYLARLLGLEPKLATEYGLWKKICTGQDKDGSLLKYMLKYNKHDVTLLEEVYDILERYNDSPIIANQVEDDNPICPFCASKKLQKRGKFLNLKTWRQRYQCRDCGKFLKGGLQKKDDYFFGRSK